MDRSMDHQMDPKSEQMAHDQDGLSQWFVPTEEVPVPEGFAARVTSMAFDGAAPSSERELRLVPAGPGGAPSEGGRMLSFTMALAAVAAAAVLIFSVILAGGGASDAPSDGGLSADTPLEEKLEQLEAEYQTQDGAPSTGAGSR